MTVQDTDRVFVECHLARPRTELHLPDEQWRWIPGFEGRYEVSNYSRVRSYVVPKHIKPALKPQRILVDAARYVRLGRNNLKHAEDLAKEVFGGVKPTPRKAIPILPGEEWCDVAGCEGRCAVSNLGRFRGTYGISKAKDTTHYRMVSLLSANGDRTMAILHLLILETFVGPRPSDKHIGLHANDIRSDNRLCNLRWGTREENARDLNKNFRRAAGLPVVRQLTQQKFNALVTGYSGTDLVARIVTPTKTLPPPTEEWRWINGQSGKYDVSNYGRVRSYTTGTSKLSPYPMRVLKMGTTCGYPCVGIRDREIHAESIMVHRLVASAFLGSCPAGHEVRHLDGNRANNCSTNLAYGTRTQNSADAKRHGTVCAGSRHWGARVNEAEVLAMRRLYADGVSQADLRRVTGISSAQVCSIVSGKAWKHIPLVPPLLSGVAA